VGQQVIVPTYRRGVGLVAALDGHPEDQLPLPILLEVLDGGAAELAHSEAGVEDQVDRHPFVGGAVHRQERLRLLAMIRPAELRNRVRAEALALGRE
jgi:hypothetical protein